MATRSFRGEEGIESEPARRKAVAPFLKRCGYKIVDEIWEHRGTAITQFIVAKTPQGNTIKMRVRLCWRWELDKRTHSAAQLRSRLVQGSWDKTLKYLVARDNELGVTHAFLPQLDGRLFVYAALIPVSALEGIWKKQEKVSGHLIESGKMGRITKNHARNGNSPSIWLMDSRHPEAHAVADVLWSWPGVIDLAKSEVRAAPSFPKAKNDDTYDDLAFDPSLTGSDGALRRMTMRSEVKRSPKVRAAVIERCRDRCERAACGIKAEYAGFLDVHHILGAEKSDRIWNCVALCPNCHRAAHFAPDRDEINEELLAFAVRFKARAKTGRQRGASP